MTPFPIHHVALTCDNPLAVEAWYTKHFGFERKRVYLPGPGQVVVIGTDGLALELFPAQGAPPSGPPDKDGPPYRGHRHVAFLVDDLMREEVAMAAAAPRDQIAVDDDVLVGVDRAHVLHVAEQVVVRDDRAPAHELGHRRDEPHPVADDALHDALLRKGAREEFRCRWYLVDVLRIAQAV